MIPQHNQVISPLSHSEMMDTMGAQQQQQQQQFATPPVFGSQMVDKNSSTPYTDATQAQDSIRRKLTETLWSGAWEAIGGGEGGVQFKAFGSRPSASLVQCPWSKRRRNHRIGIDGVRLWSWHSDAVPDPSARFQDQVGRASREVDDDRTHEGSQLKPPDSDLKPAAAVSSSQWRVVYLRSELPKGGTL
uniref:Uncharacterized protein n=1 Tax=Anopheles atroparvus TaxID=41427 RepID=A0A182JA40_ANOAO